MITDSAFIMGSTHKVCQDYAKHNNDLNTVIISDGCSSSPDTDVGSRILTSIFERHLNWYMKNSKESLQADKSLFNEVINQSTRIIELLGYSKLSLDATLLAAYPENGCIKVLTWGDGCVVARVRDTKELVVTDLEYADGYPYYLNYVFDSERQKAFLDQKHGELKTTISIINPNNISATTFAVAQPFSFYAFETSKYDLVAIMSDGIRDFNKAIITETTKSNIKVNNLEMINKLFDFKSFNGLFVQRRLNKFIKDLNKENVFNFDDFSIGAIYID